MRGISIAGWRCPADTGVGKSSDSGLPPSGADLLKCGAGGSAVLAKDAMLVRSIVLAALVLLGQAPLDAALADEPGREVVHARRALVTNPSVVRSSTAGIYVPARALVTTVPPCEDVTTLLLSCVPRRPFPAELVATEIATASPPYTRPYRQLFSWD